MQKRREPYVRKTPDEKKVSRLSNWASLEVHIFHWFSWFYDWIKVCCKLSKLRFQAATKKHEAIETDIYAYEERVQAVVAVADELKLENYHDIERIDERWVKHSVQINVFVEM